MAPFDGTLETTTLVQTSPDLSKPTLIGLAWYLDHPELWRDTTMEWDFGDYLETGLEDCGVECGTAGCALGLARTIWPEATAGRDVSMIGEEIFGLNEVTDAAIFVKGCDLNISPAKVATRIRAYLSGQPIPL